MKFWNKVVGIFLGVTLAICLVTVFANASKLSFRVRATSSYSCNDIVFSETVDNPSAYADISDLRTKNVTSIHCSMTNWTNANYASTMTNSAIKIGGSKSGKYAGSVDIKLKDNVTTDKLIIYATGWSGDSSDLKLKINETSYQTISATSSSYVFSPYTFTLSDATSDITLYNNQDASGKSRIVISKIVFRLYGSSSGGGESSEGDSSSSSSSSEEPTSNTVTLLPDNSAPSQSACSITEGVITASISDGLINDTQFRVYKGKTLTISSTQYITSIVMTCTAEDSNKYGPGCFTEIEGYTYSSYTGTWTGESKSIVFTASLNQVRITQIVVTIN